MALRATLLLIVGLSLVTSATPAAAAFVVVDYNHDTYQGSFPSKPGATGPIDLGGGYGNDSYTMRAFSNVDPWSQNNAAGEPVLYGGVRGEALQMGNKQFDDYNLTGRTVRYQTSGTTTYFAGTEDEITVDQQGRIRMLFAWEATSGGLSFDADSSLSLTGARWENMGTGRWLVRDGGTYYVSESTVGGGTNLLEGTDLLNERWAVLDAASFIDDFAADAVGTFETRSFSDLNRFGFISDKSDFTKARHWQENFDFQAMAVPEPATLALLGIGGLGVLLRKRR